jgi:hypothetical protein
VDPGAVGYNETALAAFPLARAGFSRYLLGALGRIRTCDTCLRRAVLYPLSYEGCCEATWKSLAHV